MSQGQTLIYCLKRSELNTVYDIILGMTQEMAVKIWVDGAVDALDTCDKLFKSKKYHHALFFLHLALEKIIKALYISKKDSSPPYIHNLKQIAESIEIDLNEEELDQLDVISEFNVSGRYEEYKYKIYKKATKEYTEVWMDIGKKFYKLFLNKI